jgi:hypothetical protein
MTNQKNASGAPAYEVWFESNGNKERRKYFMKNLDIWLYHYASRVTMWLRDLLQQMLIMVRPIPAPVACQCVRQSTRHPVVHVVSDIRPNTRDIVPWI